MAPDPGGHEYTAACAANKAIPDSNHLAAIRDAVLRVHNCTMAATELLNLYVRDRIENHNGTGLADVFKPNWLLNAYHEVKVSTGKPKGDEALHTVFETHMKDLDRPAGKGITQALTYECINLAAVGSTNVWKHFQKRVVAFTRTHFALSEEAYKQLSKDQRRARKLAVLQAAEDVCRNPSNPHRSPAEYHAWVDATRARLGIDAAVGEWSDKPLLYHLKVHPERFLVAMHLMSTSSVEAGRKAFALFPLRRSNVPRHVRFDKAVLDELLHLGAAYARNKSKSKSTPDLNTTQSGRAPKRKRDDPSLIEEKAEVFNQVLDLRAAGVHRRHHFAFAFTTDGFSVHLNMHVPGKSGGGKAAKTTKLTAMPTRGIHSIDALKALAKKNEVHTVGIDPGKRELIVAVDTDDPQHAPVVRYTLAQRRRDLRTRQYTDECRRSKPQPVAVVEEELSLLNSKAPSLAAFAAFAAKRRQLKRECPSMAEFYTDEAHRHRRRKTKIKAQQSEARLVKQLQTMHTAGDGRQLVLAYGAWGLAAGRPNMACNKGNPPAIGVGLMKKLALHFVVAPTPEHYTSKTCAACMGTCGPHPTLKTKTNKEIRGLRVCQNEGCGHFWNRDKLGARNIGTQFQRLFTNQGPLKALTDEEAEFHRLNVCLECV
tara:strand:- start:202 stop:2163 length:1962 start_codon:yes stop_codon:yes gene_type:complete